MLKEYECFCKRLWPGRICLTQAQMLYEPITQMTHTFAYATRLQTYASNQKFLIFCIRLRPFNTGSNKKTIVSPDKLFLFPSYQSNHNNNQSAAKLTSANTLLQVKLPEYQDAYTCCSSLMATLNRNVGFALNERGRENDLSAEGRRGCTQLIRRFVYISAVWILLLSVDFHLH